MDDEYWLRKSKEELGSIIDEYKNRAILAEEKNAALDIADLVKDKKIDVLEASVDSLKKELALAKKSSVAFMAAGDKAALEQSKVSDGTSFEIMSSAVDLLEALKLNSVDLPKMSEAVLGMSVGVPKSFGILTSLVESRDEASAEGLEGISGVLNNFGFRASGPGFDIPGSLATIQKTLSPDVVDSSPAPMPTKPHAGECNYKLAQGQTNTLTCTLGCTELVHTIPDNGSAPIPQSFAVPPPGFAPGASGLVLGEDQLMQPVYGTTPTKTGMSADVDFRGGLNRQMKQKVKHNKFKTKQKQHKSNDQLLYMDGLAYQKGPQQIQANGQQLQHQHHQQQHIQQPGPGNYLLHPSNFVNTPGSSIMPQSSLTLPGNVQYQGQQFHR